MDKFQHNNTDRKGKQAPILLETFSSFYSLPNSSIHPLHQPIAFLSAGNNIDNRANNSPSNLLAA